MHITPVKSILLTVNFPAAVCLPLQLQLIYKIYERREIPICRVHFKSTGRAVLHTVDVEKLTNPVTSPDHQPHHSRRQRSKATANKSTQPWPDQANVRTMIELLIRILTIQLWSLTRRCRNTTVRSPSAILPSGSLPLPPRTSIDRIGRNDQRNMELTDADRQANRYKTFRWTPRAAWVNILFLGVFPAALGYVAYKTEVCLIWAGLCGWMAD